MITWMNGISTGTVVTLCGPPHLCRSSPDDPVPTFLLAQMDSAKFFWVQTLPQDLSWTGSDSQADSGSDDVIPPCAGEDGRMVQMCGCKHAGNRGRTHSDLRSKKTSAQQTFIQDKYLGKWQPTLCYKHRNTAESCSGGSFLLRDCNSN